MHPSIQVSRDKKKQAEIAKIEAVCAPIFDGIDARVYLFGSYATGQFSAMSDVDVLLVSDDESAARLCASLLSGDTLITTPTKFEQQRLTSSFWKNLDADKEIIFEFEK